MEGRGGCCIARYGGYYHDVSSVDRIMMRFRPIAPKPTSGEPVSPVESLGKNRRGKRRYTTKNGGGCTRNNNKKRKATSDGTTGSSGSWSGGESEAIVTLPLLPDAPVEHVQVGSTPDLCFPRNAAVYAEAVGPTWLCFGSGKRKVESWVTVECVTETWVEGTLGSTDEERRVSLDGDTCPGFESDGVGRVRWTNEAYGKMVGQGEVVVWLAMKERVRVMLMYLPAFTCRVRMQYGSGKEMRSMTVPCDAWRMDSGGFAWRLDVKAALTL